MQRSDNIDHHAIVRLRGARHHFQRQDRHAIDQLVKPILLFLPSQELFLAHATKVWLGHRWSWLVSADRTAYHPASP